MSGHMKKHLTRNEASAVVSLLFKSTGIDIPKDKKNITVEKVIELVEEIIEEVQLEAWNKKRQEKQLDPANGSAAALKGARLREGLSQVEVVKKIIKDSSHTMFLEKQNLPQAQGKKMFNAKVKELTTKIPHYLWEEI